MPELLDPPRHLRLVTTPAVASPADASQPSSKPSSQQSSVRSAGLSESSRLSRHRTVAELGGASRSLYRLVAATALASGARIDRTALRVILAVRQSRCAGPLNKFSSTDVWQLLFVDILSWCRARHLDVPPGCGAALEYLLETLHQQGELHPDSDNLDELLGAVDECTGGWDHGPARSSRHRRR